MLKDSLLNQLSVINKTPNKFTIGMGKLIRTAREEAGYSQRELAELIYRRQAALSDMENGKMEPDATTLLMLAYSLRKPINYFYPIKFIPPNELCELQELEEELLLQVRRLSNKDLRRLIAQAKALADLDEIQET